MSETDEILAELRKAGERRNRASRHTMEGLQVRAKALEDIRAYATEGRRLQVTHERMQEAVGVKSSAWFDIMNGKVKS